MTDTRDDFGPCECGKSTIRGCAEMPSRHCGLTEDDTFEEIKALRTHLQTVLHRETATTARYDARIAALEADVARLKDELDTAYHEAYDDGYSDGQRGSDGVMADLWSMLLRHLEKHDCTPASDDGQGHNAHQVMDAVFEREANIRADGKRLMEAENARLREVLRPFVEYIAPKANDGVPDNALTYMGYPGRTLTMGDFRRAREVLKETK